MNNSKLAGTIVYVSKLCYETESVGSEFVFLEDEQICSQSRDQTGSWYFLSMQSFITWLLYTRKFSYSLFIVFYYYYQHHVKIQTSYPF